jgi:hypothetical protein
MPPTTGSAKHPLLGVSFLKIRDRSGLFWMSTFNEVQANLHFLNDGSSQTPNLVVMQLNANGGHYGLYKHILIIFNTSTSQQSFA